jgi:hypothetical protein
MTPEEILSYCSMEEQKALGTLMDRAIREAYEDAARIAETYNEGRVWAGVAASIRARASEGRE